MNNEKKFTKNKVMKKKILCVILLIFCFTLVACNETTVSSNANIINVNDISINKSHAYVDVNKTIILLAQVFPFNADNQKVIWKSANPEIAIVSDGMVTGKKEGRTTILATSEDGNLTATCIVYVSTPKLDYNNTNKNINQTIINNSNFNEQNTEEITDNQYGFNVVENYFNYLNQLINAQKEFYNNFVDNLSLYDNQKIENLEDNLDESEQSKGQVGIFYYYNSNGLNGDGEEITLDNEIYQDENTIVKKLFN